MSINLATKTCIKKELYDYTKQKNAKILTTNVES